MKLMRSLIIGTSLGALIGLSFVPAAQAKETEEEQKEIQALRAQIDALQRRLDAQAAAEQQTKAAADAAAARAASAQAQAAAVPGEVAAQVKTEIDAAKPKTDKIYYRGATITLGGFLEAASIYRTRDTNNDIQTGFNAIPFNNNSVGQTREFLFTARQSRVQALATGDPDPNTHLGFYTEADFLGAAQTANSKESNSYTPRIRQVFGYIAWDDWGLNFSAGQSWSLVTLSTKGLSQFHEEIPAVIDAQYVPGFTWARQPGVRLVKNFDDDVSLAVSVENPQTTFYAGANALPATVHLTDTAVGTGTGFNTANTYSLNHVPDVIAKLAVDPMIADRTLHLEAYGLYRDFYERLNYANQDISGGGVGAGLVVPVVPKVLEFQLSGLAGKGIGRYGAGQLSDVTLDPSGTIQPIHEVIALAGLTLHASPMADLYLYFGEEKESAQPYDLTNKGVVTPYGYGNPLYSNTGCVSETAAGACVGNPRLVEQGTLGFWLKPYIGNFGYIRWGLQYSHTELQAFDGKGGAPTAIDNIVMASFRYYPYSTP